MYLIGQMNKIVTNITAVISTNTHMRQHAWGLGCITINLGKYHQLLHREVRSLFRTTSGKHCKCAFLYSRNLDTVTTLGPEQNSHHNRFLQCKTVTMSNSNGAKQLHTIPDFSHKSQYLFSTVVISRLEN